ncbi:MAG: hypothetical protein RL311_895, partial [Bacteroidota bacterium]
MILCLYSNPLQPSNEKVAFF